MAAETYSYGDNAYCTPELLAGLGAEFSVPAAWDTSDQQAEILRSSKLIDLVTGQHFGRSLLTLLLDGSGTGTLLLTQAISWRCISISSIKYREEFTDAFASIAAISASYYTLSRSKRAVLRTDDDIWEKGIKNYQFIGYFGRRHVPKPIEWACVLLTRERITPGSAAAYDQYTSESFGDGYSYTRGARTQQTPSLTRSTGVPQVDLILSAYVSSIPSLTVPGA